MFVDYAKIKVISGKGGNGCVSFRRERFVPKGGPDGGNGGRGGHIIFKVDSQLHTLQDIKYRKQYKAENGKGGSGGRKSGRNGKDVVITVPKGTIIRRGNNNPIITDLTVENDQFIAAKGGDGGRGNCEFVSDTNQTPHHSEEGFPGEEYIYEIELKLLADVGLVGLPNAGKSTLLSRMSSARPKIADYPFTTLQPHLGIVKYKRYKSFVMADIPGLIEGAGKGKGLGHRFLKHIERTSILALMIDCTEENPENVYYILLKELEKYNPALLQKPRIIILSKIDLLPHSVSENIVDKIDNIRVFPISSVQGYGLDSLSSIIATYIDEE